MDILTGAYRTDNVSIENTTDTATPGINLTTSPARCLGKWFSYTRGVWL